MAPSHCCKVSGPPPTTHPGSGLFNVWWRIRVKSSHARLRLCRDVVCCQASFSWCNKAAAVAACILPHVSDRLE